MSNNKTDGSFVAMERNQCHICGKIFDTGNLLLNKRLQNMPAHVVTGMSPCPECTGHLENGMVALVEVKKPPSWKANTMRPDEADRTGKLAWLRRTAWGAVFPGEPPDTSMVFVEEGTIAMLEGGGEAAADEANNEESGNGNQP